jgi:hypothetical protein
MRVPGCVVELGNEWGPETAAAAVVDVTSSVVAAKASVSRAQIEER